CGPRASATAPRPPSTLLRSGFPRRSPPAPASSSSPRTGCRTLRGRPSSASGWPGREWRVWPRSPRVAGFRPAAPWGAGAARTHQRLGEALLVMGRLSEAMARFRLATALRRDLALSRPADPSVLRPLAVSYWKLSEACVPLGRFLEAQEFNRESLELHERIA